MFGHKTAFYLLIVLLLSVSALTIPAQTQQAVSISIQSPSIPDLISHSMQFDGQVIAITGEVIGDIMQRGNFAWINILENGTALGIWVSAEQASMLKSTGKYQHKGDVVRVTGVFHRACPEHGGDADVHAMALSIIQNGTSMPVAANIDSLLVGILLCVVGGIFVVLWRRRERDNARFARGDI